MRNLVAPVTAAKTDWLPSDKWLGLAPSECGLLPANLVRAGPRIWLDGAEGIEVEGGGGEEGATHEQKLCLSNTIRCRSGAVHSKSLSNTHF